MPSGSLNAVEGYTKTGAAALPMPIGNPAELRGNAHPTMGLRGDGNCLSKSPHKRDQLTGNGHAHRVGVFPSGDQTSIALAQPDLGLPADVLDGLGLSLESEGPMSPHLSWIPVRPGAFDQGATGMGVAGLGDGALAAALARGRFRGDQPPKFHAFSGGIEAREVSKVGYRGDRDRELHTAECLKGLDYRV
jgi:hypothetical protein